VDRKDNIINSGAVFDASQARRAKRNTFHDTGATKIWGNGKRKDLIIQPSWGKKRPLKIIVYGEGGKPGITYYSKCTL
jgi:hypothetical protein